MLGPQNLLLSHKTPTAFALAAPHRCLVLGLSPGLGSLACPTQVTARFQLSWGQGHCAIGIRGSQSRAFSPAFGIAEVVMGALGMEPGEEHNGCLSVTPSTLKPAFDHHARSWTYKPQSVPLDSKTRASLGGQPL